MDAHPLTQSAWTQPDSPVPEGGCAIRMSPTWAKAGRQTAPTPTQDFAGLRLLEIPNTHPPFWCGGRKHASDPQGSSQLGGRVTVGVQGNRSVVS
jgi:hypothetical protein